MKYSLMTTAMFFPIFGRLQAGCPMDRIREEYAQMLAQTKALGIDAVEITSMEVDVFGLSYVKEVLKNHGLHAACLVHMDTWADTAAYRTPEIHEKGLEKVQQAKDLGAPNMMLALMPGSDAAIHTPEEKTAALIRNMKPVSDRGAALGIKVSVEDTPNLLVPLSSTKDTKALLDGIPSMHLTYDTGNMLLSGEDSLTYYRTFKHRVSHVHLKDMRYADDGDLTWDGKKMTAAMHGSGLLDFPSIINALKENGYDGYLVIEYVGSGDHFANIKRAKDYLDTLL